MSGWWALGILALVVAGHAAVYGLATFLGRDLDRRFREHPPPEPVEGTLAADMEKLNHEFRQAKSEVLTAFGQTAERFWRWARGGAP